MIDNASFVIEPWRVREVELQLDRLAQTESVFALANGHIGWRGNLDEGEPNGLPGSYLGGFFEAHPLPYAEAGYGNPESGQAAVNVTNGKIMRLLVEDEPFDLRYGELRHHERVLDLRTGLLHRQVEWVSPTGQGVRIRSTRLVSFAQRAVAAISYEVEALDGPTRVVVQSELVANEPLPALVGDPRDGSGVSGSLQPELSNCYREIGVLVHRTAASGLKVAAAMDHDLAGCEGADRVIECMDDLARLTIAADLAPDQTLRVVKFVAYGWSHSRSTASLHDQVRAGLAEARKAGWDGLIAAQKEYLDDFWDRADIEVDGDPEVQQAVRFGLFHTLQSGARAENRAIPAKGLTGSGYDGHTFWDTEMFVLLALTYTIPDGARDALAWRHRTLPQARERASQLGLRGAAFAWRTIHGEECSGYWPAGTAAFHNAAAVADAVIRYQHATEDEEFARGVGFDLLTETARLWHSLGHHDAAGRFRIDGVTGPDEYSAVADNNIYTNLMAERNLRHAADAVQRFPKRAAELKVDEEEAAAWRDAAKAMFVPYDADLGVHPQAELFTEHAAWDFSATSAEQYPLLLNFPYFDLYRKRVVKQADLVLALHIRGDAFTLEEKARNFAYYEAITVRDSSLSACTQAVVAAELGHLDLAYDYLREAALIDLDDLQHNTRDGLHIASLAGSWIGIVAGFGGLRDHDGLIAFAPRLPPALQRMSFRVCFRGRRLRVEVDRHEATYTMADGQPLHILHHGDAVTVEAGRPLRLAIPRPPKFERPRQPPGRAPGRHRTAEEPGGLQNAVQPDPSSGMRAG